MKSVLIYPLLSILVLAPLSVDAANGDGAKKRQQNQAERIGNGIVDGELTSGELKKVQQKQQKVEEFRAKAMADGNLSAEEKAKLHQKLNNSSEQIYRLKHNDNGKFRAKQEQKKWDNLETRLGKGVSDGTLTIQEANEIRADMQEIQRLRELGRQNGKLSPAEAKMLRDLEKKVSQKIYAERHDTDGIQKAAKTAKPAF